MFKNMNDDSEKKLIIDPDSEYLKNKKMHEKNKSKFKTFLKFLLTFLITLSIVLVGGYIYLDIKFKEGLYEERSEEDYLITEHSSDDEKAEEKEFKEAINILIMGTDNDGYRSDVAMLVHYDPYTKTTSLFSVPRDYKISLSEKAQEQLNYYAPYIKFTEIFSYCKMAEMDSPASYVTQVVEELLNIKIDHFVLVDLSSFKAAVDAIGGVEAYVPQYMYYHDPYQDLHIDLAPGLQLLDGDKAEQLVRYRQGYDNSGYGDFGRMQMQQYFLTAFAKKLLSMDSIDEIKKVMEPVSEMLTTDASLGDALWILKAAKNADFNRVNAHTLPGLDSYINDKYFFSPPSDKEVKKYFIKTVVEDAEGFDHDSKSYNIAVYSSSYGQIEKAQKLSEKLQKEGYKAEYMGLNQNERLLKSVIIVPDDSSGGDLKQYLDISEIRVDENPMNEKDIIVIVGEVQAE